MSQAVTAFPGTTLSLGPGPAGRPSPRQLFHDEYTYRPDDYLTAHSGHGPHAASEQKQYQLDPLGRIAGVRRGETLTEAYRYDSLGNIIDTRRNTTDPELAQPNHAVHDLAAGCREYRGNLLVRVGATHYHYDAAGRLIRTITDHQHRDPDIWHYRFNAFDQLTDVWTPDQQWWHYTYDCYGRRTTKQHLATNGNVLEHTDYAWDESRLIEESTGSTNTRWDYEPGTFAPITQAGQDDIDRRVVAIVTDPAGAPTALLDPRTGQVVDTAETDLQGHTRWCGGATMPLRLAGQFHDPETGLHYDNQRYYDPRTGRYLSPEPRGLEAGPNDYGYSAAPLGLIPTRGPRSVAALDEVRMPERPGSEIVPHSDHGSAAYAPEFTLPDRTSSSTAGRCHRFSARPDQDVVRVGVHDMPVQTQGYTLTVSSATVPPRPRPPSARSTGPAHRRWFNPN